MNIHTFSRVTKTTTTITTTTTTGSDRLVNTLWLLFTETSCARFDGEHFAGAAKRRRERRHRAFLKYARMSVVWPCPSTSTIPHEVRGWTGPGGGNEQHYTARSEHPTPRQQALSTFLLTSKMCLPRVAPRGSRSGPATHCGAHH